MEKRKLFLSLLLAYSAWGWAQVHDGFAIVVDPVSYQKAEQEIREYAQTIEETQKMKVFTIVDQWGVPDSIKKTLQNLYHQEKHPIQGAVFLGDIPVPMIRDAQHLTTAFKMSQSHDRRESSVPSDRFYDDFDLQFASLGKDDEKPYYYYSLTAQSTQTLEPEIYTGRIRPGDDKTSSRYDKLRRYLKKAIAAKKASTALDQLFFFSGHGYISESKPARMDEKIALYEHFPALKKQQNSISYMDHTDHAFVKEPLMNELMRPDLDLAILHHHGAPDTEYLNNIPSPENARDAQEYIKSFARSRVYNALDKGRYNDSLPAQVAAHLRIPEAWMEGCLDPQVRYEDSLKSAALDLHLEDFEGMGFKPNARVVILDACFNGSFHLDDCIANRYIFSTGNTVACIANSVNALQDKWSDRFIGLLGLGAPIGAVVQLNHYLESHLIGDPTFHFGSSSDNIAFQKIFSETSSRQWRKMLKHEGEWQTLALNRLDRMKQISSEELLSVFLHHPTAMVRMEAFELLEHRGGDCLIQAIKAGVSDSHELIQRMAIKSIAKSGDPRLAEDLIRVAITNNTSDRCNFNAISALALYPEDMLLREFYKQFDSEQVVYLDKPKVRAMIEKTIRRNATKWSDYMADILSPEASVKKKKSAIRVLRNYGVHARFPELIDYAATCENPEIQVLLLEALGWHHLSYQKEVLVDGALRISKDEKQKPEVRAEAEKTYKRLLEL